MQVGNASQSTRVSRTPASPSSSHGKPAQRRAAWAGLSAVDVLKRNPPGSAPPEKILEILLELFNEQHTARQKSVSHKTRHDRAVYLRRFLKDLRSRAGFATLPDPRNLGGRHIQATVDLWRKDQLAAATIQTYLSFLRGLAHWIGKPGMVLQPAAYGLAPSQYKRHEVAQRDRSWTGAGIDIDPLIAEICAKDRYVGAALRLIRAFGLRRKEAVMMRPHACVVPFEATGLPLERKKADKYLWVRQGSKGGRSRFVAIQTQMQHDALVFAQQVAGTPEAHLSDPSHDLKQNLSHFSYMLRVFGLSLAERGATGHGLRHEVLVDVWRRQTGTEPPVRNGEQPPVEIANAARQEIAEMAGHARKRAAGAYIGSARAAGQRKASGAEHLATSFLAQPDTNGS